LIEPGVFTTLKDGPLTVGLVPVIDKSATTILVKYGAYFVCQEAGKIKQSIKLCTRKATALYNVGIGYVRDAGGPVNIEWADPLPTQYRNVLDDGFS
jgi:hypothetical protein